MNEEEKLEDRGADNEEEAEREEVTEDDDEDDEGEAVARETNRGNPSKERTELSCALNG